MELETLEVIVGLLLLFFGIYLLYFMDVISHIVGVFKLGKKREIKPGDIHLTIIMLLGIVFVVAGAWMLVDVVGIRRLMVKFAGLVSFLFASFLVFYFPDSKKYQPAGFETIAVLLGIVFYAIALYLLIFA